MGSLGETAGKSRVRCAGPENYVDGTDTSMLRIPLEKAVDLHDKPIRLFSAVIINNGLETGRCRNDNEAI